MNKDKPKLLLHTCCAPCLAGSFFQLKENFDVIIFWFNPNIEPEEEYKKRYVELQRLSEVYKLPIILSESDLNFSSKVSGLENEPEGGKRCDVCFRIRLEETAKLADDRGFDFFATTLTVSPYKNADLINKIGLSIKTDKSKYLESDFKKNNGYQKSIETCKEYSMYRQKYCGCIYSKSQALSTK